MDAQRAIAFAKAYVHLVEALTREGVLEETARDEARMAAMAYLMNLDEDFYDPALGGICPTCGRK
jgi:hypothetical protein